MAQFEYLNVDKNVPNLCYTRGTRSGFARHFLFKDPGPLPLTLGLELIFKAPDDVISGWSK